MAEKEIKILSVTEQGDELLIAVQEMIYLTYGDKDKMGVGGDHLLVLKPDKENYTLVHHFYFNTVFESWLDGAADYVSDEARERLLVMKYDENDKQWYVCTEKWR